MTTEKMRVSANSIRRRVAETNATASKRDQCGMQSKCITPTFDRRARPTRPCVADNEATKDLTRAPRDGRWIIAIAAVLWVAMLPAAAYAASMPTSGRIRHAIALVAYGIGSLVCHQRPERSFHLF